MSPKSPLKRYLLRIELNGTQLPVWREVTVPATIGLDDLHEVIQVVMGWEDMHLHFFKKDGVTFESADTSHHDVQNEEEEVELNQLLKRTNSKLQYVYDFGDDWIHTITLKKILPWDNEDLFVCSDGTGACPMEDCGGLPGHEAMCRSGEIRHPEAFEPGKVNRKLADLLDFMRHDDSDEFADIFEGIEDDALLGGDDASIFPGLLPDREEWDDEGEGDEDEGSDEMIPHPYFDMSEGDKFNFTRLFRAGELVRAAEPWKDLWDQDVFCMKDPDTGLLDFVSVLGRGGEIFAVHVHHAPECYDYWRQTKEGTLPIESMNDFLRMVRMVELEFINKDEMDDLDLDLYEELGYKKPTRGQQKWMRVRRYHPRSVPYFAPADLLPRLIRAAQLVVHFVAAVRAEPNRAKSKWVETGEKSAGLPAKLPVFVLDDNRNMNDWSGWKLENREVDWSPEGLSDGSYEVSEFDQERVALLPASPQPWEVGAIFADEPIATKKGPVVPIIAMAAPTAKTGEPPVPYISYELDESPGKCLWQTFADTTTQRGERPKQLNVMTDIAEKTFQPFAERCGMKLKRVKQPEVIGQFFEFMRNSE